MEKKATGGEQVCVALNIADLTYIAVAGFLLADFVDHDCRTVVDAEPGRVDGAALLLNGPAACDEARLWSCVALLIQRLGPKTMSYRFRAYRQKKPGGSWTRIKEEDIPKEYKL